jgi:hypothetical protein
VSGIARSGRDTRHPNRVLANTIAGNDAERWPRAGKVRFAGAKHEGAEVETIFVDKTEFSQARRQDGARDVDLTVDVRLQSALKRIDVLADECGVRADRLERT